MKAIICFSFVFMFWVLPCSLFAEPIQVKEVEQVANSWIKHNASFNNKRNKHANLNYKIKKNQIIILDSETFPAYAIELEPFGYLIISADDNLPHVLSFSADATLDLSPNINNSFRQLLKKDLKAAQKILTDKKTGEIQTFKENNQLKWRRFRQAAESLSLPTANAPSIRSDQPLKSTIIVDEMLQTRWNQNNHYNELTPESSEVSPYYDGHVPTGCVATASAQVMKYHNWPWYGKGQHSYTDNSGSIRGSHTASFSDTYDWANMQNVYEPYDVEPEVAVNAVSELMYEVGVGSEMDYEPDGSATSSTEMHGRLAAQFYYHRGEYVTGTSAIINALIAEMEIGAPCAVSILGHGVVVDGYSTEGADTFFHVNYGWGGENNGWYLLNGVPGGGISKAFPGNIPRAVPLIKQSTEVGESFLLQWKFPQYYPAANAVKVYEGRLEFDDLIIDAANDFSNWERTEGASSQWTIQNGQFHWARNTLGVYNSLQFTGPVIPSVNTTLVFDFDAYISDEKVTLEVSTDNGETWTALQTWTSDASDTYAVSLSAYAGTEISIRFNAIYITGSYYNEGVSIDNIKLSNCQVVRFAERTNSMTTDLANQSITISNLTPGDNFYRIKLWSGSTWSEPSPIISIYTPEHISVITSLTITGSTSINENSSQQYTCTANYDDGSQADVSSQCTWSENSIYTTISTTGLLTAQNVTADQNCRITAAYGGKTDTHDVTIKNVPVISSLTITGSTSINENSSQQYTCTANYDNGSQADISSQCTWSENSIYTTISTTGLLTAQNVTADQNCRITAAYGGKTDTLDVTIIESSPEPSFVYVSEDGLCSAHSPCYAAIGDAYQISNDGQQIRIAEGYYAGDLLLENQTEVTLSGGWNDGYSTNSGGRSIVGGSLTITGGTLIIEGIIIGTRDYCNLLYDDFSEATALGWSFDESSEWQLSGGRLQVTPNSNTSAIARRNISVSGEFTFDVDVSSNGAEGNVMIYAYKNPGYLYYAEGRNINGVAIVIFPAHNQMLFYFWDLDSHSWFGTDYQNIPASFTSFGMRMSPTSVIFRLNGSDTDLRINGSFDPLSALDGIWLAAGGDGFQATFDNVCIETMGNRDSSDYNYENTVYLPCSAIGHWAGLAPVNSFAGINKVSIR